MDHDIGGFKISKQEKDYLKSVCKKCKAANGGCIKFDVYIGLCAENDAEELIELKRKEGGC